MKNLNYRIIKSLRAQTWKPIKDLPIINFPPNPIWAQIWTEIEWRTAIRVQVIRDQIKERIKNV